MNCSGSSAGFALAGLSFTSTVFLPDWGAWLTLILECGHIDWASRDDKFLLVTGVRLKRGGGEFLQFPAFFLQKERASERDLLPPLQLALIPFGEHLVPPSSLNHHGEREERNSSTLSEDVHRPLRVVFHQSLYKANHVLGSKFVCDKFVRRRYYFLSPEYLSDRRNFIPPG